MKEINLDQILEENAPITCSVLTTGSVNSIKAAMMEACKQILELAAKNARLDYADSFDEVPEGVISENTERGYIFIDKQSILDTINQVK